MDCKGYGAHNDKGLLVPIEFKRRFGFGLSVSLSLFMLCCVEDFPCLSRDSDHDSRLQSLSVATGLQGQMMWLSGLPIAGCAMQRSNGCSIEWALPSTLLSPGMYVPKSAFYSTIFCNFLAFGNSISNFAPLTGCPSHVHPCCLSFFQTAKIHPAIDDCRYKVVGIYYAGCDDDDDDDEQLLNFKPRYSCQF